MKQSSFKIGAAFWFMFVAIHSIVGQTINTLSERKDLVFDFEMNVLGFVRNLNFQTDTLTVNPDNQIAKLDEWDDGLFFRPKIYMASGKASVKIEPRLNILNRLDSPYNEAVEGLDHEFYFQSLQFKYSLSPKIELRLGRYHKPIGSSVFVNPSNPFFKDAGRFNPKFEIRPLDYIEVNYAKDNTSYTLVANIGRGESIIYKVPFFDFEQKFALIVDTYLGSLSFNGIVCRSTDNYGLLGFSVQKFVSESTLLWMESSVEENAFRFSPIAGNVTELIPFDVVRQKESDVLPSVILGGSYSLKSGPTLQLEYYYNGLGYDETEKEIITDILNSSSEHQFDVTKDLTQRNLGRIINSGMPYSENHYLFLQLSENELWENLDYSLRYFQCLDDKSAQISGLFEYNYSNAIELHLVASKNFGGPTTDFGKLVDHQLMAGAIYRF